MCQHSTGGQGLHLLSCGLLVNKMVVSTSGDAFILVSSSSSSSSSVSRSLSITLHSALCRFLINIILDSCSYTVKEDLQTVVTILTSAARRDFSSSARLAAASSSLTR